MKIALRPTGTATLLWLAGEPDVPECEFSSAGRVRITPSAPPQMQQRVRAANMRVIDRKNLLTTLSWETTRTFATAEDAFLFSLDYDTASARSGTLILLNTNPGGYLACRYLTGAVVEPPARTVIGVSVQLSYTASGGAISAADPD